MRPKHSENIQANKIVEQAEIRTRNTTVFPNQPQIAIDLNRYSPVFTEKAVWIYKSCLK